MTNKLNDAPVLDQVDGQWQQLAMLILWKTSGRNVVKITAKEIEEFRKQFEPGIPVIFTHGHSDSIEFSIVDEKQAQKIAQHQATLRGRS